MVTGTHADIRQVLNLLSTFKLTASAMNYDQAKELYVDNAKLICRIRRVLMHVLGAGALLASLIR